MSLHVSIIDPQDVEQQNEINHQNNFDDSEDKTTDNGLFI